MTSNFLLRSFTLITSPAFNSTDGMSTGLLLMEKCPWMINCRRRFARRGKAHAVNDIVKPSFERLDKNFRCLTRLTKRLLKIISELCFEQSVHPADFLFLPKLEPVFRNFLPSRLPVRTRAGNFAVQRGIFP